MEKTVLTELIENLELHDQSNPDNYMAVQLAKSYLEKEKQHLIEFHKAGYINGQIDAKNKERNWTAEQYFNNKYNKE